MTQTISEAIKSPYRGSESTYKMVREQIRERWGDQWADSFDPVSDAMPFRSWLAHGYRVRKGEKALRSITFVEKKDAEGNTEKKYKRTVFLFHRRQVERIQAEEV